MSRRAIQDGTIAAGFNIHGAIGQSVQFTPDLGDIEDARSLMLDVRKFFLKNEAAHFTSIANILEQRLTDDELRDANRTNRESWKRAKRGGLAFEVHGTRYDASKMFNLMVNGGLFHFDAALAATWDALDPMSRGLMQAEVHRLVVNSVRITHAERNLIRKALADALLDLS